MIGPGEPYMNWHLPVTLVFLIVTSTASAAGFRGGGFASGGGAWGRTSGFAGSSRGWTGASTWNRSNPSARSQTGFHGTANLRSGFFPGFDHRLTNFRLPPPGFRFRPFIFTPIGHPFVHHRGFRHWGTWGNVFVGVPYYETVVATTQFAGDGWPYPPDGAISPWSSPVRSPGQLAPFDPTPHDVVDRMLALAKVKSSDVVYDLGAGDGRLAIAAAKKYGARAVGFEIDPGLAKLARENVRREGVEKLVEIRQQDFMRADLSPASVVTLYLSYDGNLAVRPRLLNQLRPGSRVVSNTFDMGDWQPKIAEAYRDSAGDTYMLYYWEIAEPQVYGENFR